MNIRNLYFFCLILALTLLICLRFLFNPMFASDIAEKKIVPQIASWYLEDDVITVDSRNKTITLPKSLVVLAGNNQSKAFGFNGGAIFSYDVKGIGNGCKIVFNPSKLENDEKFYVVGRDHSLDIDEYYFCGIILEPFMLDVPADKVLIDGCHPVKSKDKGKSSIIFYNGEKLIIPSKPKNALSCLFIGEFSLKNDIQFNGSTFYAQGMAICGNYLFRIGYGSSAKKTLCQIFDISNLNHPKIVSQYFMAYDEGYVHANCCQFGNEIDQRSGFPLLYIRNGDRHACIVERVTLNGSEFIQRINIDLKDIFSHGGGEGNTIIGDDGYIWYFGEDNGYQYFCKFRKPSQSTKHVTLTSKDVIDYWELPVVDGYENRTWQGGKVKDGKIYFLYGESVNTNRLYVIDINMKKITSIIPLSSIVEEVEDIDFGDSYMLVGISSAKNGAYQISNIAN